MIPLPVRPFPFFFFSFFFFLTRGKKKTITFSDPVLVAEALCVFSLGFVCICFLLHGSSDINVAQRLAPKMSTAFAFFLLWLSSFGRIGL